MKRPKKEKVVDVKKEYNIPDTCKMDTFTNKKKTLSVNVNGPVDVNTEAHYPTVQVSRKKFTQEEADKVVDYFMGSDKFLKLSEKLTKAEIEQLIITKKKDMQKFGDIADETGVKPSKQIETLKQQLSTASDADKSEEASKQFVSAGKYGGTKIQGYKIKDGKKAILTIDNGIYGNETSIKYTWFDPSISFYSILDEKEGKDLHIKVDEPKTSEEDAKNQAEKVLADLGYNDFAYYATTKVVDGSKYCDMTNNKLKTSIPSLYQITFTRVIEGAQVSLKGNSAGIYWTKKDDKANLAENSNQNDSANSFQAPWQEESINVLVSDEGVIGFSYTGPCNIDKVETKDSNMLDFAEIQKKFQNMILVHMVPDGSATLNVKKVSLHLQCVQKKNSNKEEILVPVWRFNGDGKEKSEGIDDLINQDVDLIELNAIDGSYIYSDLRPQQQ